MTHKPFKLGKRILILCLAGLLPIVAVLATTTSPEATPEYTEVTLNLGNITKTVIATGSLRFDKMESLTLPEDVTLRSIEAAKGNAISSGQVLARYDAEALQDAIDAAQTALDEQDETLLMLLSQQRSDQNIKPAMAGVVKAVNLQEGQMVQQSLQGQPLAVLSTNGLMQVSIKPTTELSLGQTVRVIVGTQNQAGNVARLMDDGSALIFFPDTRALADETVQVTLSGVTVGEGSAQIGQPYYLYTDVEGVVDSIPVKVNASVTRNSTIAKVKYAEPSAEYQQAVKEREDMAQHLLDLQALLKDPVYRSPMDGIVAEVSALTGQTLKEGDCLLNLYPEQAFMMDVSVDELDILTVMEGQEGTVILDALSDIPLPVRVERISRLGNTTSGITNYTVTLSVREDSRLLS
ncbi:MAG TPA: HlyD family efflux transporter periplasmic adaptor subunit, partial [Clostridia bacterium]|nr:HlyD family efflux transporter periplasmic adaptor subunit [Clostridia bacterium]